MVVTREALDAAPQSAVPHGVPPSVAVEPRTAPPSATARSSATLEKRTAPPSATARSSVTATRTAAIDPGSRPRGVFRLHAWADAIAFVAVLNLLILVGTLAGGVIVGWAPSMAAAVAVSRKRIRGDAFSLVREFLSAWRRELTTANLLQAPGAVLLVLLAVNLWFFSAQPGYTPLLIVLGIAGGLTVVYQLLLITMDAHYELTRPACRRLAGRFLLRFPGAPLLLAATTALIVVATAMLPGLLPVVSIGAWTYLCTALCLSFYAANDRNVASPEP